jgi:hypothetical protein
LICKACFRTFLGKEERGRGRKIIEDKKGGVGVVGRGASPGGSRTSCLKNGPDIM